MEKNNNKNIFATSDLRYHEKLKIYHDLLLKWQKAINLISPKTVDDSWVRHFEDSLQIMDDIPMGAVLADIGTGAGFPGLVLAIARPDLEVHLIESDQKKCQFLKTVSRETSVPVSVHNMRIEESYEVVRPDIVTARALKDLTQLCEFCLPWAEANRDLKMVFLKGQNAAAEIGAAKTHFDFEVQTRPSQTDPAALILILDKLRASAAKT